MLYTNPIALQWQLPSKCWIESFDDTNISYAEVLKVRCSPFGNDEPIAQVQLVELQEFGVMLMPRATF